MTAAEFRATHGDPAGWSTADHEAYDNLATLDAARHQALGTVHQILGGAPRAGKTTTPAPATAA